MEVLFHRKKRDVTHPSMRNEVGKSLKQIVGAFITASRAHGVTDEQREAIVRRHRNPPAYTSVSEAKEHDSKRGGGSVQQRDGRAHRAAHRQEEVRTCSARLRPLGDGATRLRAGGQ